MAGFVCVFRKFTVPLIAFMLVLCATDLEWDCSFIHSFIHAMALWSMLWVFVTTTHCDEHIKLHEIVIQDKKSIGEGAFGVVYKAEYRGIPVAVKRFKSENKRGSYENEFRQLSRVSHENIIRFYGACSNPMAIVLELAERGSLYNLLHGSSIPYNAGHAMSWGLQCAQGTEYLHNMKPKALIHGDLTSLNLLLTNQGLKLKICDFGSVREKCTLRARMAPEHYSTMFDLFGWGVILWEVITRRNPSDEFGESGYQVMNAVRSGRRPRLIRNCPPPIQDLMTKCWSKTPSKRPSMQQVVIDLKALMQYFPGGDEALAFDDNDGQSEDSSRPGGIPVEY